MEFLWNCKRSWDFSSIFTTPDNQKIIVPNGDIIKGSITNINAYETRRIDLVIGVDYKDDIKKQRGFNLLLLILMKSFSR